MSEKDMNDETLEGLFAQARADPPQVSAALLARVVQDAQHMQAEPRGRVRNWWRALGGAPGWGGLVMATCVGFWLGVAPPEGMPYLADQIMGQDVYVKDTTTDMTGFGWDSEEG